MSHIGNYCKEIKVANLRLLADAFIAFAERDDDKVLHKKIFSKAAVRRGS